MVLCFANYFLFKSVWAPCVLFNPIRYGGGPGRPGSQENPCGSLEVVSKLLKFLDFVPFNLSQVLVK